MKYRWWHHLSIPVIAQIFVGADIKMFPDTNYPQLDSILETIHKNKIRLDEDRKKLAVGLCMKVKDKVTEKLNESDSILRHLLNGITYRGSYFGGVKVGQPDEFDIDIELKLPFNFQHVKINISHPGYININIKEAYNEMTKNPTWNDKFVNVAKWMDKEGFLMETEIRKELERVFTKQFGIGTFNLIIDGHNAEVKIKKSGPAFTFHVKCNGMEIDIDFVFVIYFKDVWPPEPVKKFSKFPQKKVRDVWYAVPKPNDSARSFRLSFPTQEKYFLDSSYNLKFIYRLLKALRDSEKWNLCSYHIATLFLWESERTEEENANSFWLQCKGNLFVYMLQQLSQALEEKQICFFWDKRCNMIEDLNSANTNNMKNRIKEILKQIDRKSQDKAELEKYLNRIFKCDQGSQPHSVPSSPAQQSSKPPSDCTLC